MCVPDCVCKMLLRELLCHSTAIAPSLRCPRPLARNKLWSHFYPLDNDYQNPSEAM